MTATCRGRLMVKLTKGLAESIKKVLQSQGIKWDSVDIKAAWDVKLTKRENLLSIVGTDKLKPIKYNKEEKETLRKELLEKEKKIKQEQEVKSLEEIKKSITPSIEEYYAIHNEFVKLVAEGFSNSLILIGKTATGKTWNTLKTLDETGTKYIYHSGFTTPFSLYKFLYEHREGFVIFFDDTVGIISSDEALAIMFPALWSTTGIRTVRWSTTSKRLKDIPDSFAITSRIIFCMNEIPEATSIKAIVSRCQRYKLDFTYKQMIQIMYEIAKTVNPKLTKDERFKIVDFISENTDTSTKDLNLRTQKKCEEIYLYSREHKLDWQKLALELIKEKNDAVFIVKRLLDSGQSVDRQIKEFIKTTGLSRATYFRIKKRLVKENG